MGSLLYATPRNGLPEETATVIRAVDMMAEASAHGHYVAMCLPVHALRSGRPLLGGSVRVKRPAEES